jgi:hypothetical protein
VTKPFDRKYAFWPFVLAVCALTGCPESPPPIPRVDGGPPPRVDANTWDYSDSDGDGLCDRTEGMRGSDPLLVDSDGDGLSDRVEIDYGYEPSRSDIPNRSLLVFLNENSASSAQMGITYVARAEGQSYAGAFQALAVNDRLLLDARDYYAGSFAIGAMPPENVFEVRETEEAFLHVMGRTLLVFEVRFAFAANLPRECARAYPWRYNIKRDDGAIVQTDEYLLVIVPEGQRAETAEWCVPEGNCI